MRKILGWLATLGVAGMSFAAQAATPAAISLAPGDMVKSFTSGPNAVSNPSGSCTDTTCDFVNLTVNVPAGFTATHPDAKIHVNLTWGTDVDYDLEAQEAGSKIASGGATGSPEDMDIASTKDGIRTIKIYIIPYAVAGGTATGKISFVPGAEVTPGSSSGGSSSGGSGSGVTPTVPNPIGPGVPRYQVYAPPEGLSGNTGEPSVGYNPKSRQAFILSGLRTLWAKFPQDLNPKQPQACDASWEERSAPTTSATTLDPIGLTDSLVREATPRASYRTWIGQLAGKAIAMAYSDDDGVTWTPTEGNTPGVTGFDHEGIAAGPYPKTGNGSLIPHPTYPNAFYYCGQDIAYANCTRSDDGGITFKPPTYMYTLQTCAGLHGHPRVAPDGTVYVPNPSCGGNAGVAVSEDAGLTWNVRKIPDSTASGWDPQAAIGTDGTIYFCSIDGLNAPYMSVSKDKGLHWSPKVRLAVEQGIEHAAFPQAVAGTDGRASCAFLGTRTKAGSPNALDFTGVWHLYFATTYDFGKTFTVVNATPNDPVQGAGGIWDSGGGPYNRNLLDFNEMTIDENGFPIYGYTDGCVGSCNNDPSANTFVASPRIARQIGGPSLYADKDRVPALYAPPESCLFGTRNAQEADLTWREPENGGAAITGYKIYRSDAPGVGSDQLIGETGPKPFFRDLNVDPTVSKYYYRIKAINSQGEGLFSNEIMLPLASVAGTETPCDVPGITIATDASGDGKADNTDLLALSVSEPQSMDGKLLMRLKVKSLNPVVPGNLYTVRFHLPTQALGSPNDTFVGMVQDNPGAAPAFVYGKVEITDLIETTATVYTVQGTLPGSSFTADGTINLVVPRALFSLNAGDKLSNFIINVHSGAASTGMHTQRSQTVLDSSSGVVNYTLRDAKLCLANTAPTALLNASTTKGPGPLSVVFDGSGSTDAEDSITEYYYDFGDGSPAVTNASPVLVTHEFASPGFYKVRLAVKDARGKASSNFAVQLIEVQEKVQQAVTPFYFTERRDVPVKSFITSEAVTLAGYEGLLPISIADGGQYSVNGGAFTNSAGQIAAGSRLVIRNLSASTENTAVDTHVTVGAYTAVMRSITTTLDRVPDAFSFGTRAGQEPTTSVSSDPVTLQGFNTAVGIVAGPNVEYRIGSGNWTSAKGMLQPVSGGTSASQPLQVRATTNSAHLGYTKVYLKVGGVTGYFTLRTK